MEFAQVDRGKQRAKAGIDTHPQGDNRMLDLILIALGLGFFVLAVGYTIACDRL
jgi:K+-transporting ATPase KdpF subunit